MLGGILGGLALGGLLAWAFSGTGFSTLLLIALLAIVAVLALRGMRRREVPAEEHLHLAGVGPERVAVPVEPLLEDLDDARPSQPLLRCPVPDDAPGR